MSRREVRRVLEESRKAEEALAVAPGELPLLLTPEQAFSLMQVGRTHGWRLINAGVIPVVRLSPRCIRVPRQALEGLIAAGGVQSARAAQTAGPLPLKLRA